MSKEDFNELRDILLEASGVFLEYALIHNKKGNDDKCTRNNILSEKQDRALKLLRGMYQDRTFTKEDAEPEVIILDGYKVDKRYSLEITDNTIIAKYCNLPVWSEERRTYTSNTELQQIVENQLEVAFAQGYEVCYQELGKFTKEDVERVSNIIDSARYELTMDSYGTAVDDLNAIGKVEE
jgi:hypothetical protein